MGKKSSVFLDMTAMCDVAFLLLTFFMLAGNFKKENATVVDVPSSTAHELANEENSFNIIISQDSLIFFSVSSANTANARIELLKAIGESKDIDFSPSDLSQFAGMSEVSFPMRKLKSVLAFPDSERRKMKVEGISVGELNEWISTSLALNPQVRISVRGDKNAPFPVVDEVLRMLQENKINKFDLITSLEN